MLKRSILLVLLFCILFVGVSNAQQFAYMTYGYGQVSVLDTTTKQITTKIPVGADPLGIAITPDGSKVYVGNSGDPYHLGNTVSVVDTATNTVLKNITVGNGPQDVAITPDGSKVYVTNWYDDNVSVISTASDTLIGSIPVIDAPNGITITGNKAYVANSFSEPGAVSVIDTTTDKVVNTVILNKYYPFGIAASSDGKKVYVTDTSSSTVSVIDTTTNTVTANISVNMGDDRSEIATVGNKAFVTSSMNGVVYDINTTTDTVDNTIQVGGGPMGISVTPNGKYLYVSSTKDGIDIIDTTTDSIIDTIYTAAYFIVFKGDRDTPYPILPIANFSTNVSSGYVPLSVKFTDTSTNNPVKWKWNFGDGNNSTEQNPIYTYSNAGSYTVNLTASNENGSTYKEATILVAQPFIKPIAAFSATPTSGKAPLSVKFTDQSANSPTSWRWGFGDGTVKNSQNPNHTYNIAGNYTVKLTATNVLASNTTTKTNYIKVIGKPIAVFTAKPTYGNSPLKVTLKDASAGSPTSWKWNFGDGSTKTSQNPIHIYLKAGSYTVKLTATNAVGSNTTIKTGYINTV